jgi:putative ABC transport system permease protein
VGVIPTTVEVGDPGEEQAVADAVTRGPLSSVLLLHVVSGSLRGFRPGDVALSELTAGPGAMGVHVGERITTYLADGTRYRARVTAIYDRSLGFADVLVPVAAAGGGHLGTSELGQVLVRAAGPDAGARLDSELGGLAARFPGARVVSRSVANGQASLETAQSSFINDRILALIALLAAVAMANTLVMTAIQGGESLRLLLRVGAAGRQLLAMRGWQAVLVGAMGITFGAAAGALPVIAASRALTGSWVPYLSYGIVLQTLAAVLGLAGLASLGPAAWALARPGRSDN